MSVWVYNKNDSEFYGALEIFIMFFQFNCHWQVCSEQPSLNLAIN